MAAGAALLIGIFLNFINAKDKIKFKIEKKNKLFFEIKPNNDSISTFKTISAKYAINITIKLPAAEAAKYDAKKLNNVLKKNISLILHFKIYLSKKLKLRNKKMTFYKLTFVF